MSPTLLELVVVLLLVVAAWWTAKWITPDIISAINSFWRDPKPPVERGPWPPEKNITPPAAPNSNAAAKHGPRRQ